MKTPTRPSRTSSLFNLFPGFPPRQSRPQSELETAETKAPRRNFSFSVVYTSLLSFLVTSLWNICV
jgi:hypothetical protein